MGIVYEAFDRRRETRVALKTLRNLDGDSLLRFKREYRSIQGLQHPNLVSLGDLVEENGAWFFTMDLVHGVDFLRHVRGRSVETELDETAAVVADEPAVRDRRVAPRADETILRDALRQLAQGVAFLHGTGNLHRDLKPSNVLVDDTGGVVILDLGLVYEVLDERQSTDGNIVGTVAYMSPEQAAAQKLGPESDWYSVGVMLYEALTGCLPHTGTALEVLAKKQQIELAPPSSRQPGVPADLDGLCHDLLRIDPARRPSAEEIVRRLGVASPVAARMPATLTYEPLFVGREDELRSLERAFADCASGRPICTIVHGVSGVGKSALIRRFVEQRSDALVLAGRCYERESVPYKAVDGVIDAISRHMMRLPRDEVAALLPRKAALLSQAFPVLLRIESIASAPRLTGTPDPHELRSRLFGAVREMFARLADRHRTIVWIDDLQWADQDSLAMLDELLREPDAPPILLLATSRSGTASGALASARHVHLTGLSPRDAGVLAKHLLERAPATTGLDPDAMAREAQGHPLFVYELVQHGAANPEIAGREVGLDQVLWSRVERLSTSARAVLECVATAGRPLAQSTIARAVELSPEAFGDAVDVLRAANLVRTGGPSPGDPVEPYHDRVRESVAAHIPADTLRSRHEALAVALTSLPEAAPDMVAAHWLGAGKRERAAEYAERAAKDAALALAFDRAVDLYRLALDLSPPADGPRRLDLQRRLGDALAYAGRGAEAARAYLTAAPMAAPEDRLDLERRAAEELLSSGHVDEGLSVAGGLLAAVGMKLPKTRRQVLSAFVIERTRLRLRGLKFRERSAENVPPAELRRIDVGWSVLRGMSYIDPPRFSSVQARNLAEVLDAGEPSRIARSLALEATFVAIAGATTRTRVERLLELARPIANRIGDEILDGHLAMSKAHLEFFCGAWRRAAEGYDQTAAHLLDRCRGVVMEVNTCRAYGLLCRFFLGELAEMARRDATFRQDAESRGDLYQLTTLQTMITPITHLAADRPQAAREAATEAMQKWTRQGFLLEHFLELMALDYVDLYEGRARDAWNRTLERWQALEGSLLFKVQVIQIRMTHMRGCVALSLLDDPSCQGSERRRLAREARTAATTLVRSGAPWAEALAGLLLAGLADRTGDHVGALGNLERASERLDALDMALYAACARRYRGRLVGGTQGAAEIAAQDAWMRGQGVVRPASIGAMLALG